MKIDQQQPATTSDLNIMLRNVPSFKGTYARDKMPVPTSNPFSFIVNTDPSTQSGEHWNAIVIGKSGTGIFFNSFGLPPLHPTVQQYFVSYCPSGFKYNAVCLQYPYSSTCGYFAADFINSWVRGENLEKYISHYSSNLERNDQIVIDRIRQWGK